VGQDSSDDEAVLRAKVDSPPSGDSDPELDPAFNEGSVERDESIEPPSWPGGSGQIDVDPLPAEIANVPPGREAEVHAHLDAGRRNAAIGALMKIYGDRLMIFAVRILRNSALAEEVTQQVFVQAFKDIGGFEKRSTLWCWLCGIAYHRCLDELRRIRRERSTFSPMSVEEWEVLVEGPEAVMDADRIAKQRALMRCLERLRPRWRAQLLLKCLFGLTYQEIGKLVNEPHGRIQVRMSRILPRLRRCLRGEGMAR